MPDTETFGKELREFIKSRGIEDFAVFLAKNAADGNDSFWYLRDGDIEKYGAAFALAMAQDLRLLSFVVAATVLAWEANKPGTSDEFLEMVKQNMFSGETDRQKRSKH